MSATETANGAGDPVMQPFVDMWAKFVEQANDTTRQFLNGIQESTSLKTWQRHCSEALSKSMDAYMRSPVFLKAMKQNIDAAIKLKLHCEDVAGEVARNMNVPMASDISGLFERLHSVEETILERLGCIEERLETIEECALARKAASQSMEHP